MLLVWWWMQNIYMVDGYFLVVLSSKGIVDSSYVIVSAAKWAITCVSWNGPMYGLEFLYQSVSGDMSIVIVYGSFLAARRAQWIACYNSVALWGWA